MGWDPHDGINTIRIDIRSLSLSLSASEETSRKWLPTSQKRHSSEPNYADTLIIDFEPPKLWENTFLLVEPPSLWYFVTTHMPPFLSPTCRKATRIKKSEESQTTSTAKLGDITHKLKILIGWGQTTVTRLMWYWFLWRTKQKEDTWASDGPENSWILTSPTCT